MYRSLALIQVLIRCNRGCGGGAIGDQSGVVLRSLGRDFGFQFGLIIPVGVIIPVGDYSGGEIGFPKADQYPGFLIDDDPPNIARIWVNRISRNMLSPS